MPNLFNLWDVFLVDGDPTLPIFVALALLLEPHNHAKLLAADPDLLGLSPHPCRQLSNVTSLP